MNESSLAAQRAISPRVLLPEGGSADFMHPSATSPRKGLLGWAIGLAVLALFFKVFFSILAEYWWYFPPDFERSNFLSGRRYSFRGLYPAAFYIHILSGPPAALLGLFLVVTGRGKTFRYWHRAAGKLLALDVLLFLVPSGLVMARSAYAGPIAGAGFATLSILTAAYTLVAIYCAMKRNFRAHQHLATACFILLASPLLLRLVTGAAIVLHCESETFYQANAWLSWLAPLAIYEIAVRLRSFKKYPAAFDAFDSIRSAASLGDSS